MEMACQKRKLVINLRREISLKELSTVLAYPSRDRRLTVSRVVELELLGVEAILLEGPVILPGGVRVLGKGTNSIVLKAWHPNYGLVLVKALRTDASRDTLLKEAEILHLVNSIGLRPRIYVASASFIVREYVKGEPLESWFTSVSPEDARKAVSLLLDQLYALDRAGISHGELSRPGDHVLVTDEGYPVIIDYESASLTRAKRNLTQFIQFILFRRTDLAEKVIGRRVRKDEIVEILRRYKTEPSLVLLCELKKLLGLQ